VTVFIVSKLGITAFIVVREEVMAYIAKREEVTAFIAEMKEVTGVRGRVHSEDRDSMNLSCIITSVLETK